MKEHTELINEIIDKGNRIEGVRLWTNPTSFAYVGKGVHKTGNDGARYTIIKNAAGVWFGLQKGSADIIGFKCVKIYNPDEFGPVKSFLTPVFVAIEVKVGKDKLRPDQEAFMKVMVEHNVLCGVARKIDDLYTILNVGRG